MGNTAPEGVSTAQFEAFQKASEKKQQELMERYDEMVSQKMEADDRAREADRRADREAYNKRLAEERLSSSKRDLEREKAHTKQVQEQIDKTTKQFDRNMREQENRMKQERRQLMEQQDAQMKQQAQRNRENIENIMTQNAQNQRAALAEHQRKSEKAMKEQQAMYDKMEQERRAFAKQEMDQIKSSMEEKHKQQQQVMEMQLAALSEEQKEERERLLAEQEQQKVEFKAKLVGLEEHMAGQEIEHAKKLEELKKVVEKKNYESHYPIPEPLQQHYAKHPTSFNIQVLGCRGAGKSTFVNKLLKAAGVGQPAKRGVNETTTETAFYDITDKVTTKPERYGKVFLCDQPGIGGLEITEAGYLANFGPGHFNFTLMLGEKGFNEMDMALLKHLLFNKKPIDFVRTQCDASILGIQDDHEESHDEEISSEEAFAILRKEFWNYIQTKVITKVEMNRMGLPPKKFPDFKRLADYVLSGELLEKIGNEEAVDIETVPLA